MEQNLDPQKLIKTSASLAEWIKTEFPHAHLAKVAEEVQVFSKEAVAKAAKIREPIWLLRLGVWGLIALALAAALHQVITHPLDQILRFLDDTKGAAVYIVGFIAVLIGLEVRWKRRRALTAVHQLRALSHIIDMHQLAKDQAIAQFRDEESKMQEYLHACTALLALVSKIGQLYVDHFPDSVATSAVNDFEMITTGLSNKIWMKILSMKKVELEKSSAVTR
jgi:hypothetical protein